jgi:hypothetical protein
MERFWSKTKLNEATGCIEWTAALKKPSNRDFRTGGQSLQHGQFHFEGRTELAHRVAVHLKTGIPVRDLPLIGHTCDNPKCVNFDHLEPSSYSQNLKDAWERGRRVRNEAQNLIDLSAYFDRVGADHRATQQQQETTCSTSAT